MLTAEIATFATEFERLHMFATHIAAFVIGALALLVVQQLRIDKIEAKHKLAVAALVQEHDAAALAQRKETEKDQAAITQNYEGALNDARIREALLRVDIGRARAATDSLRVQTRLASSRINLPETSGVSIADYALASSELLAECAGRYQALGETADQHVSDLQTVIEAWPVMPPRPDAGITTGDKP